MTPRTLGEIIQELMSTNDYAHDEQLKDMLLMSCIKRININFKEKNYHDVITDIKILNLITYDIYTDTTIFLMYLESIASLCKEKIIVELENFKINSNEMKAVKENIGVYFNTKLTFSKEVQKPVKTKK
ncbi:unnamed protein product [Rotaria sordida]|uniref:Uncharacterized protein n=2 Tax=Rotaria sordida TaxID=392033 RepID=A0A815V1J5_9BILA|nr:unnamed protein product [Rotaria sordida]